MEHFRETKFSPQDHTAIAKKSQAIPGKALYRPELQNKEEERSLLRVECWKQFIICQLGLGMMGFLN